MEKLIEKLFGVQHKSFRGPIVVTAVTIGCYFLNQFVARSIFGTEPRTLWLTFILWFAYIYSQAFIGVYRPLKTHKWSLTISWCLWIIAISVGYMLLVYEFLNTGTPLPPY